MEKATKNEDVVEYMKSLAIMQSSSKLMAMIDPDKKQTDDLIDLRGKFEFHYLQSKKKEDDNHEERWLSYDEIAEKLKDSDVDEDGNAELHSNNILKMKIEFVGEWCYRLELRKYELAEKQLRQKKILQDGQQQQLSSKELNEEIKESSLTTLKETEEVLNDNTNSDNRYVSKESMSSSNSDSRDTKVGLDFNGKENANENEKGNENNKSMNVELPQTENENKEASQNTGNEAPVAKLEQNLEPKYPWLQFKYVTEINVNEGKCKIHQVPSQRSWKGEFTLIIKSLTEAPDTVTQIAEEFELSIMEQDVKDAIENLGENVCDPIKEQELYLNSLLIANGKGSNKYGSFVVGGTIDPKTYEFRGEKGYIKLKKQKYSTTASTNDQQPTVRASTRQRAPSKRFRTDEFPSSNVYGSSSHASSGKHKDGSHDYSSSNAQSTIYGSGDVDDPLVSEYDDANPSNLSRKKGNEQDIVEGNSPNSQHKKQRLSREDMTKKQICKLRMKEFVFSLEGRHFLPYPQYGPNASSIGPPPWHPGYPLFREIMARKNGLPNSSRRFGGLAVKMPPPKISNPTLQTSSSTIISVSGSPTASGSPLPTPMKIPKLQMKRSPSSSSNIASTASPTSSSPHFQSSASNQQSYSSSGPTCTGLSHWGSSASSAGASLKKREYTNAEKEIMTKALFAGKMINEPKSPPSLNSTAMISSSPISVIAMNYLSSLPYTKRKERIAWQEAKLEADDGYIYEGTIQNGLRHGLGILGYPTGELYVGNFYEGKENGFGSLYDMTGKLVYQGDFENGKMSGKGSFFYSNGDYYEGEVRESGMRHGSGLYVQVGENNVNSIYDGDWQRNRRYGSGTFVHSSGSNYTGDFHEDMRHGRGILQHVDGFIIEGTFQKNELNGRGICTDESGGRYEGLWRDGLKDGRGTYIFANGAVIEGRFSRDQLGTGTLKMQSGVPIDLGEDEYMMPIDTNSEMRLVHLRAGFTVDGN